MLISKLGQYCFLVIASLNDSRVDRRFMVVSSMSCGGGWRGAEGRVRELSPAGKEGQRAAEIWPSWHPGRPC